MKQFNLEEYLKNPSKKVITRDGRNVTIHCTNYRGNFPIIAEVEGLNYSTGFTEDGVHMYWNCIKETNYDLFFVSEKHEGWVNIFKGADGSIYSSHRIFKSKEDAEKDGKDYDSYITSDKIEWED